MHSTLKLLAVAIRGTRTSTCSHPLSALVLISGCLALPLVAAAQGPARSVPSVPDNDLLGVGQSWYLNVDAAPTVVKLVDTTPTPEEMHAVKKAQSIFDTSAAKVMALVNGEKVVWAAYKPPANAQSSLFGYSMGKTVTAAAVGKAICEQKLTLDTKVKDQIPELAQTDLGEATVRSLLTMSSGSKDIDFGGPVWWSKEPGASISAGRTSWLDFLKTKEVSDAESGLFSGKRKPGEVFSYRNTDPQVLGLMLNRSVGESYAKWVERSVLIPAGIAEPASIAQDKFEQGHAFFAIRMTLGDWIRFALWFKKAENEAGCFGDFVRAGTVEQIPNKLRKDGYYFGGYGYFTWTGNSFSKNSYWAVGYGGQRIGWNHKNERILVAFSNVEDYMDRIYQLYDDWAALP